MLCDRDFVLSEEEQRRRKVDELCKLGKLRGFTREYQQETKRRRIRYIIKRELWLLMKNTAELLKIRKYK
jgi:hypothetical protein